MFISLVIAFPFRQGLVTSPFLYMYIFLDDLASFYSTAQYLRISGAVLRHDLHLDVCLVPDGMSQLFQVESTFHGKLDETKQLR